MRCFVFSLIVLLHLCAKAQTYTAIADSFPNLNDSDADWGDYDNDGDLDIALSGQDFNNGGRVTRIYKNDNGVFVDNNAGMVAVRGGSVQWGDYDRDGDLDILLVGTGEGSSNYYTLIYRNDNGIFAQIDFGAPGLYLGCARWCDIDADGDLDVSLIGGGAGGAVTSVYRNDAADQFSLINLELPTFDRGSLDWGDYDNDGDQDLLLTGRKDFVLCETHIFRNDGGVLTDISAGFEDLYDGEARFFDLDQDGDLDVLAAGSNCESSGLFTKVYRNDGGNFVDIHAVIAGTGEGGALDIGDCDNDGDFDVAMLQTSGIHRYDGDSIFTNINAGMGLSCCGTIRFADYDNDGVLDVYTASLFKNTRLFRASGVSVNTPPTTPPGLASSVNGSDVMLTWGSASDAQTQPSGLSYNVRVGTMPGGFDIVSPMSDPATGYHRVVRLGNAYLRHNFSLSGLSLGTYYWSVQAIDNGFMGSAFAAERQFVIGPQEFICGDADNSLNVDISDAVFLIAYIFQGGLAPSPLQSGDADCSGSIDISDAVYLIAYIFGGGPAPCEGC